MSEPTIPSINPGHPEAFCEQCGRPNIAWWIDSDRWNLAALHVGQILCPVCFVARHEKETGLWTCWTLTPGTFRPYGECLCEGHNAVVTGSGDVLDAEFYWDPECPVHLTDPTEG